MCLHDLSLKLCQQHSNRNRRIAGNFKRAMDEYNFPVIIILTIVGFFSLAAMLLVPIYRFLVREERATEEREREQAEL